ncbi:hypothetical protein LOK49_LG13G01115 [Camellia lanceoleosa]|uniref:Uncharacterized protein n=1 Tax=Camellia lanceoleosa TaxID=1840588 RepID=A0ACC0FHT8_9ERIC|nr:hypothetical protein LOK49_LG13G01115 [Camellia lanceoleosa]
MNPTASTNPGPTNNFSCGLQCLVSGFNHTEVVYWGTSLEIVKCAVLLSTSQSLIVNIEFTLDAAAHMVRFSLRDVFQGPLGIILCFAPSNAAKKVQRDIGHRTYVPD